MKKAFLISIILGTLLLSSCQAAPDGQNVVNKQDKITTLFETQPAGETVPAHVQYSNDFMSTDDSVQFHLSIDQEFETDRMHIRHGKEDSKECWCRCGHYEPTPAFLVKEQIPFRSWHRLRNS